MIERHSNLEIFRESRDEALTGDLPKSNRDVRSRCDCLAGMYCGWLDVSKRN